MSPPIEAVILNLECLRPGALELYERLRPGQEGDLAAIRAELAMTLPPIAPKIEWRLREWRSRMMLGLVTGLPLKAAGELVKQSGLRDLFQVLVGSEHAGVPWPDPAYHRLAVERTRLASPDRCLILENTRDGVRLARAAGAVVCGIDSGGNASHLLAPGAAAVARDFDDPVLDRLLAGDLPAR